MPQIINTNIASLNAQRNLNNSQKANDVALQRLSSGLRINSAKDDAAGLAISTRFDAQIRGTNVAIRNAGDGISLAQTAEGALNSITSSLQRIRELALQSSNDTNTDVDREALNEEVQQLLSEIDATSKNASFNGRKLLDGSFTKATFQTGANTGQNISFGISKVGVDSLGTGIGNGVSSDFGGIVGTDTSEMAAGDLVINGIAVGASSSADDTSSVTFQASSAISKAAAINQVSDQTGVTATVNKNTVGGNAIGADGADATVVINGVSVAVDLSGATASVRREQMAAAINAVAGQTGVRAELANDPDGGINLVADDGRNIQVAGNLDNAGLAAAGTYSGSFTLASKDGSDISVSSDTGNIRANVGLDNGTYSGVNSGAFAAGVSASALVEGDLVINGVAVGATVDSMDTASTTFAANSAIAKANAINAVSGETGVSAEVVASRTTSTAVTAVASSMIINDVTVGVAAQANVGLQVQAIVDAVNAVAGRTGVTAEILDGDQYQLVAADGRNIELDVVVAGGAGFAADAVTAGGIALKGAGQIEISTNTGNITSSGFGVGTYGGAESGTALKNLDVSTVKGAEAALKAVDNALATVARNAASLGAIQSRFESTISNLSSTSENLSAANSRIKDADFAAETAALSRSQVLQQAGISVLAQANARPQQALSLLQ